MIVSGTYATTVRNDIHSPAVLLLTRAGTSPEISSPHRPEHPLIFLKSSRSVVGSEVEVEAPPCTSQMDYEGELAVVIGKEAKDVRAEDAMSYVYGFTVCNDLTARDLQKMHKQFSIGKSLDGFFPMGPTILLNSAESNGGALPAFPDLKIQTWVNGQLRQVRPSRPALAPTR